MCQSLAFSVATMTLRQWGLHSFVSCSDLVRICLGLSVCLYLCGVAGSLMSLSGCLAQCQDCEQNCDGTSVDCKVGRKKGNPNWGKHKAMMPKCTEHHVGSLMSFSSGVQTEPNCDGTSVDCTSGNAKIVKAPSNNTKIFVI